MVDYDLCYCYGIIVSCDKIQKMVEILPDEEADTLTDWWSRAVNGWIGEDYFIGIYTNVNDDVCLLSKLPVLNSEDNEQLIKFKQFFDKNNLWKFIDWKPELMIINFCF